MDFLLELTDEIFFIIQFRPRQPLFGFGFHIHIGSFDKLFQLGLGKDYGFIDIW